MATRREFLRAGIAASVVPFSLSSPFPRALSAEASEPIAIRPVQPDTVIFDLRFPSSVAFGHEARRQGIPVWALEDGDITDLWYRDLSLRWKQGPAAIAGLTDEPALFCLERLAWDEQRMRVVFRGRHRRRSPGRLEHELWGPATLLKQAPGLGEEPAWGAAVATLVGQCPEDESRTSRTLSVETSAESAGDGAEPLVSWLIAPVRRERGTV